MGTGGLHLYGPDVLIFGIIIFVVLPNLVMAIIWLLTRALGVKYFPKNAAMIRRVVLAIWAIIAVIGVGLIASTANEFLNGNPA